MTHTADETLFEYMTAEFTNDLNDNLQDSILTLADNWVERKIRTLTEVPTEQDIEDAATYYAMALMLRKLFHTNSDESVTADWYEKQAEDAIGLGQEDGKGANFYASNLTPTDTLVDNRRTYRRKPLRYTTEVDDFEDFEM